MHTITRSITRKNTLDHTLDHATNTLDHALDHSTKYARSRTRSRDKYARSSTRSLDNALAHAPDRTYSMATQIACGRTFAVAHGPGDPPRHPTPARRKAYINRLNMAGKFNSSVLRRFHNSEISLITKCAAGPAVLNSKVLLSTRARCTKTKGATCLPGPGVPKLEGLLVYPGPVVRGDTAPILCLIVTQAAPLLGEWATSLGRSIASSAVSWTRAAGTRPPCSSNGSKNGRTLAN